MMGTVVRGCPLRGACLLVCLPLGLPSHAASADAAGETARAVNDFPNHHIHNFGTSVKNTAQHEHALAMGYRLVVSAKPDDPKYAALKVIGLSNAHVCPVRIYREKATGETYISYHSWGQNPPGHSAFATLQGFSRKVSKRYPIAAEDLELLKGYGAAKLDIGDLTVANATYDELSRRFYTSWHIESRDWQGFNILMNWINKRVVHNCVQVGMEYFPWSRYQALFIDSLGGSVRNVRVTNADYFPGGTYATRGEGSLACLSAIIAFARDPEKTGQPEPYLLFTNIYDPLGKTNRKLGALKWYGQDILRFDHYYFEKGGVGTQAANGVVPGTTEPAYVDFGEDALPDSYLPARLVAFDDVYGWSRKREFLDDFDHAAFFEQHLDACVTAAMQGSWFGWYGEDNITRKDAAGKYIYTNALQLLRALPNWDNMAGVPVPAFEDYKDTDERKWDGSAYSSPNSYVSRDAVYSRNPDSGELYVVFTSAEGVVRLRPGEKAVAAFFVNDWFVKTDESAMDSLRFDAAAGTLTLTDPSRLGQGIRVTLAPAREGAD